MSSPSHYFQASIRNIMAKSYSNQKLDQARNDFAQ